MIQIGNNGYNMDFISAQIEKTISKIKIVDGSLDKDELKKQLLKYYGEKFKKWDTGYFEYDFIDLFCGAGGLSVGLEQVGFRPIIAIDKEPAALLTYRFNRPCSWYATGNNNQSTGNSRKKNPFCIFF